MRNPRIAWKEDGDGPPLVLIHGTGGSREVWAAVWEDLVARRRSFAIDLPGFGASPPLGDAEPTVQALAAAVGDWMREQELEGAAVAGNSLGGAIALELAKAGAASSATAFSPIGFWKRWEVSYSAMALRGLRIGAKATAPIAPALLATRLGRTMCLSVGMGRPWRMTPQEAIQGGRALASARSFGAVIRAVRDYRFDPAGLSADVPVTIAWGRRDRILFRRQGRRAGALLPDAEFTWLPGCGHVPISDAPKLVRELILTIDGGDRARQDAGQSPEAVR